MADAAATRREEDAVACPENRLRQNRPCQPDTRCPIVVRLAGIAIGGGRCGQNTLTSRDRLGAVRIKEGELVVAFLERGLVLISHPEVDGQVGKNFPVVLKVDVVAGLQKGEGRADGEVTAVRHSHHGAGQAIATGCGSYSRIWPLGEGPTEAEQARGVIGAEGIESTDQIVYAGLHGVGALNPGEVRLEFRGGLRTQVVGSAVRANRREVGNVKAGEQGIGGGCFQVLRQAQRGDVKPETERGQFADRPGIAGAEFANQVWSESVGIAQRGSVRDGILVAASVGAFTGEGNVGVRGLSGRHLVAIAEEHLIAVAKIVVSAHKPAVGLHDLGEVGGPIGLNSGRDGTGRGWVVAQDLLHDRIDTGRRQDVPGKGLATETARSGRVCNRGDGIIDADQCTGTGESLREITISL